MGGSVHSARLWWRAHRYHSQMYRYHRFKVQLLQPSSLWLCYEKSLRCFHPSLYGFCCKCRTFCLQSDSQSMNFPFNFRYLTDHADFRSWHLFTPQLLLTDGHKLVVVIFYLEIDCKYLRGLAILQICLLAAAGVISWNMTRPCWSDQILTMWKTVSCVWQFIIAFSTVAVNVILDFGLAKCTCTTIILLTGDCMRFVPAWRHR